MADQKDPRQEILKGIENSREWSKKLRLLNPSAQLRVRSARTPRERAEIFKELNIPYDFVEDEQARRDYLRYGHVPVPEKSEEKKTEEGEKHKASHPIHFPHRHEKPPKNLEELEKQADKYADAQEKEWSKKKDFTKAMDATHAWAMAKQEHFDKFAMENPKLADKWLKKNERHGHLKEAVGRREKILEAKKSKQVAPDFSWQPPPTMVPTQRTFLSEHRTLRTFEDLPPQPAIPRKTRRRVSFGRIPQPFNPAGGIGQATRGAFSLLRMSPLSISIISSLLGVGLATFIIGGIVLGGGGGLPSDTTTEPSPIVEPGPPPPCDQIDSVLLSSFGITITGDSADCRAKEIAFTTYSTLFQSEKYANLVRNAGGTTITMTEGACKGRASGDNFRVGDCSNSSLPYFFVHEMGHVIGSNSSIDSAFKTALPTLVNSDSDGYCYDGNFLKTYLLRTGVTARSESFAEAIALYYLGKRTKGVGAPIANFKTECPATYALIKDIVFGGYEFDGSSVAPGETGGENTGQQVTVQVRKGLITTTYRSANTCGGEYDLSNTHKFPIGNFGDPNCNFSKDALNDLIRRLDPGRFCGKSGKCYDRLDVWNGIIRCESGYRPNAINRQIGRTGGSGWGAWGLFQMNPDFANRATHDNGTVEWRTQVENAITRNNNTGGGFRYWSCAKGFRRGTK